MDLQPLKLSINPAMRHEASEGRLSHGIEIVFAIAMDVQTDGIGGMVNLYWLHDRLRLQ